jgi:hypothetical protein
VLERLENGLGHCSRWVVVLKAFAHAVVYVKDRLVIPHLVLPTHFGGLASFLYLLNSGQLGVFWLRLEDLLGGQLHCSVGAVLIIVVNFFSPVESRITSNAINAGSSYNGREIGVSDLLSHEDLR